MSRSNPYKKKKRETKRTLLLYCEGADEKAFLNYLKTLFSKDSGVSTIVKENHGGEANGVLANVLKQIPADSMACIYDIDTEVDQELKSKVKQRGIICIENNRCLEAFLLNVLEDRDYSSHITDDCKKIFEEKYLDGKKRKDKNN